VSESLTPGAVVGGRFRIIKRLGMGGMGQVYLANAEGVAGFEKLVALKVAHGHVSHDKNVMEMFLTEARLSALLQHPNLGQVYDLGQSEDLYFIAMEYIRGVDLRALLNAAAEQGGRLPLPVVLAIVSRLLEGLDYAHALRDKSGKPLKLVHRDVTPVNTLLSYTGEVKLIDFGIAKAADQVSRTRTGMIRGKLSYMSPEQARAQPLDRRSDLFAVGVILYELLLGVRPFDAPSEMQLMENIVEARYTPPRELDPEITPELEAVVARALKRDRTERFESASEMQTALEKLLRAMQLHVGARELGAFVAQLCPPDDPALRKELTGETNPRSIEPKIMTTRSRLAGGDASTGGGDRSTVSSERPAERTDTGQVPTVSGPLPEQTDASAMAVTPKVAEIPSGARRAVWPLAVTAVVVVGGGLFALRAVHEEPQEPPKPRSMPVPAALPAPPDQDTDERDVVPLPASPEGPQPEPDVPPAPKTTAPVRINHPPVHVPPRPSPLKSYVNVKANRPVELFVDGASAGSSPKHTLSAGKHQLRADCLYADGRKNALNQSVLLPPEQDFELAVDCPAKP
jgi:serine/threonine-protein kinase